MTKIDEAITTGSMQMIGDVRAYGNTLGINLIKDRDTPSRRLDATQMQFNSAIRVHPPT
jgi:4-aminobutyrate aminotransferase-like enzyme